MQETVVRTRKLGGSIFVRIPKEIVEKEGISEGQSVKIRVTKARRDWFGSLKGVGHFSKDDEFDEKVRT